jgi:hypothetical protein
MCNMNSENKKKYLQNFSWKSEDKKLERPGRRLEGFIKVYFKKRFVRMYIGFRWLRIRSGLL